MMDNDNKNRGEKTPSAWLVTGGRMFKDRAFISEAGAIKSAQGRGDGANVEPLYLDDQLPPAPVAEEIISTLDVSQVQVGEKLYTHPQPAIDVDALAEMLWENEKLNSALRMRRQAKNLAIDICNWIEEQQK